MANSFAEARAKAGLTQTELANALGITQSAVAAWENGSNKPKFSLVPKIAALLGCTIGEVFDSLEGDNGDQETQVS